MNNPFERTRRVLGPDAMTVLRNARIAVFGIGGVGGNAAEALARSGVGTLDLFDSDEVVLTNLNRQVIALHSTLGKKKVEAAKERIMDISPETEVHAYDLFYLPETRDQVPFAEYDYIIDAIDTVTAKLDLIEQAVTRGIPIVSSMGTGNRADPSKLRIKDVYETSGDPLARIMRHELRKRGIQKLTVCCSEEEPVKPLEAEEETGGRRSVPGSTAFVPPAAGLLIASYAVRDLTGFDLKKR